MRVIIDNPFITTIVNNEIVPGITLTACQKTKISELKDQVAELTHIPVEYFELGMIREEVTLNPDKSLADNVGTLRLRMVIDVPQRPGCMTIFIKTLTGKTITLVARPDDTVALLQYFIYKKEGIPPGQQCITYSGEQPCVSSTLRDYKIGHEATVHLVLRLAGCGSTRVTVVASNGDEYVYTSPCCCYVTTVKSIVRQEVDIPFEEQRLLFEDVEIEDGEKLKKYTLQPEVRLRLEILSAA